MGFFQAALKIVSFSTKEEEKMTPRDAAKGTAVIAGATYVAGASIRLMREKAGKQAIALGPIAIA